MTAVKYIIATEPNHLRYGWDSAPEYTDPREAAVAWHQSGGLYPLRVRVDGRLSFGTAEQVQPVFDALARLSVS